MATLTVDQIQYNGGQVFTLPTTAISSGDMIKTDGSGALGFRQRLTKVSNAAGTVNWNTPSTVTAGKVLGTAADGNLAWVTGGGNPEQIGDHSGLELMDKLDMTNTCPTFNGTVTASPLSQVANITLEIPNTVNASDVQYYYIECYGVQIDNGERMCMDLLDSTGTSTINGNQMKKWSRWMYNGSRYTDTKSLTINSSQVNSLMRINEQNLMACGGTGGQYNDTSNTSASKMAHMRFYINNNKYMPTVSMFYYGNYTDSNSQSVLENTVWYMDSGNNAENNGQYVSKVKFATEDAGVTYRSGLWLMYAVMKDGA